LNHVHISAHCFLSSTTKIIVGNYSAISVGTKIFGGCDDFSGKYLANPTIPSKYTNVKVGDTFYDLKNRLALEAAKETIIKMAEEENHLIVDAVLDLNANAMACNSECDVQKPKCMHGHRDAKILADLLTEYEMKHEIMFTLPHHTLHAESESLDSISVLLNGPALEVNRFFDQIAAFPSLILPTSHLIEPEKANKCMSEMNYDQFEPLSNS
jgi:hypothetical protein